MNWTNTLFHFCISIEIIKGLRKMDFSIQIILSVISASSTGLVGYLLYKFKKRETEKEKNLQAILLRDKAIIDGLSALCQDRILQGYRYYRQHNGITTKDLETMTKLYKAYHNLGGNGALTAVYEKIIDLPIKSGV